MAAAAKQAQQQMAELVMEHERALQTQPHAALLVANQAEHEEGDGEVDLNETWNEVGSPMPAESPAPGALVEEFLLPLTPTPHAVQVLEEVARAAAAEAVFRSPNPSSGADTLAMRQQLQEALAVIREQDRLIQEAIMGKLPSWQTSTDARANSGGVSTLVGSSSTPNRAGQEEGRAQCPDSIMKILAPGRGVNKENGPVASLNANALLSPEPMLAALEQEIFDEGMSGCRVLAPCRTNPYCSYLCFPLNQIRMHPYDVVCRLICSESVHTEYAPSDRHLQQCRDSTCLAYPPLHCIYIP